MTLLHDAVALLSPALHWGIAKQRRIGMTRSVGVHLSFAGCKMTAISKMVRQMSAILDRTNYNLESLSLKVKAVRKARERARLRFA